MQQYAQYSALLILATRRRALRPGLLAAVVLWNLVALT